MHPVNTGGGAVAPTLESATVCCCCCCCWWQSIFATIIVIATSMFTVLSSRHMQEFAFFYKYSKSARRPPIFGLNQIAWAKDPPKLQLAAIVLHSRHHSHLLPLSPKAKPDTHLTIPWRVEGWADLAGYLPRRVQTVIAIQVAKILTNTGIQQLGRFDTTRYR